MTPPRGFDEAEYAARTRRAQTMMETAGLSALLLTTAPELQYYTGFLTRFWESPTRPWFVVIPASGKPVAVVPSIGAHLMGQTWLDDIRTWSAPNYEDDGIGLLAETLAELTPPDAKIGTADAMESHLRMPLASIRQLEVAISGRRITGDATITRTLRLVKSEAEIAKITQAIRIAHRAFDRVPDVAAPGLPLSKVFRDFQRLCLEEGADWVPYLAGAAEPGGYGDVISPASDAPLSTGDVLMLDTGLVWDGYFCDYDRNFSLGSPAQQVVDAQKRLIDATEAGFEVARPGACISDVFHAMQAIADPNGTGGEAGRIGHGLGLQLTEWPSIIAADYTELTPGMVLTLEPSVTLGPGACISDVFHAMQAIADPNGTGGEAGRIGHGLGLQLTEWPSIIAADHTELTPGMVLTLEPSVTLGPGKLMVHEENIVIRENGAEYLTTPEPREIRVIPCP